MSGLTTSGASILSDIESLPNGLLLWRAMEHWIGGVGIVLVFVALLPMLGISAKKMFHVEAPGPVPSGVRPRIRETAVVLISVYLGLTAVQMIILYFCGMSWFDAFCHTAATVATGGFSPRNASVGAYASSVINWTIIVFMILSSVNFGLYYQLTRGQWRQVLRDSELRVFAVLVIVSAVVIIGIQLIIPKPIVATTGDVLEPTVGHIVEQGAFMAASIQTTTGFGTSDYNDWPFLAHAALIAATFIGGCAGSTTGGIKVIRFWIVLKIIFAKIEQAFRPQVVRTSRTSAGAVSPELKLDVVLYAFGTIVLLLIAATALMLFEAGDADFTSAFTACLANFCTTGPGMGKVGPIANYGWMTDASKITLCGVMLLGRLEIFPILVLAAPAFWRDPR
jgi:trk system potassium uptake protein TrkH